MVNAKKAKAPVQTATEAPPEFDDWTEILIVAGTPIRSGLDEGETFEAVYLGKVGRESKFGHVNLHLYETAQGLQGMWGHHALDEAMARCKVGVYTRIDGKGTMDLDRGVMRLIRVRQRGDFLKDAPIIDESAEATDAVYKALGIDPEQSYRMDHETGEVHEVDETAPKGIRPVFTS